MPPKLVAVGFKKGSDKRNKSFKLQRLHLIVANLWDQSPYAPEVG